MTREAPPRLKHDPELGPLLSAADVELAPDRLARNAARVRAAIAERDRKKAFPLWRVAVPIALVLATIVVARALLRDDRTAAPPPDAAPAPDATSIAAVAPSDPDPASVPDPDPVLVLVPGPVPDHTPRTHRDRPPAPAPAPDAAPAPAPSDLPEQIRLYESARAAGKRGELARGIDTLDELLRRFPSTPLRAEAELTRAELLTRADRLDDAASALGSLVADGAHAGRRGELLRALGDVHRKQGDCTAATDAYTRAREEKLSTREAAKVARGLERCESLKAAGGSGDPSP